MFRQPEFLPVFNGHTRKSPRWEPSSGCITPPPQLFPNNSFARLCSVKWHKWEYQCTFRIASPQMLSWCCTQMYWEKNKNKTVEMFCLTWPFTATIHKAGMIVGPSASKSYTNSRMQSPDSTMGKTVAWSGQHLIFCCILCVKMDDMTATPKAKPKTWWLHWWLAAV